MLKSQNRTVGVIVILLMLATSPISVTYTFADTEDNQDKNGQDNPKTEQSSKKERLEAILTEKVVDGKLEVKRYALPDDISEKDVQRMLSFEGQTSGWAYIKAKAYNSGIILFDGKASKVGENLWEISTNGVLTLGDRQFDLELSGKSNDSHVVLHGTASNEDLNYRVIFSGKITETDEENVFAISFMKSGLKNPEMGQNIKIFQFGEITINSEKPIGTNQEFRNSISVR